MNDELTKEEMKAMQGTEFIYIFDNGDTMPAYVKKFDEKSGRVSCWSFSLKTDQGTILKPMNEDEKREEACCLYMARDINSSKKNLKIIKETGIIDRSSNGGGLGFFNGCVL